MRQYQRYNYARFIPALQTANIQLNRKVLADMAASEPFSFKSVVDVAAAVEDAKKNESNAPVDEQGVDEDIDEMRVAA